jgi:uncharacterized protein YqjF (DUF2071 family)
MVTPGVASRHEVGSPLSEAACPQAVPWPLMDQDWAALSFLHWRYEPDAVRKLLPAGLTLDTFEGWAWVSLVPFLLRVRVPRGPVLPWVGVFPETNVRTYVRGPDGRSGICFLSLDAPRWLAVWAARRAYHLPYQVSAMRLRRGATDRTYASWRVAGPCRGASSRVHITLEERIPPPAVTDLDRFLTNRWRLYAPLRGGIGTANVEHAPYALWHAVATDVDAGLLVAAGLPRPTGLPLVRACDDVRAAMSRLRPCPGFGSVDT